MRGANITVSVAVSLWVLLALAGHSGLNDVVAQDVPGYPNFSQVYFYLVLPLFVVSVLLFCDWICNALKQGSWLLISVSTVSFLILLPYFLFYGGGA